MFKIDISNLVPDFILNDKNGYAIAKALEAGAQMMNDIIAKGVACVLDYDTMPEWRLDELAWETNCLYDYNADIETKRKWIKNAIPWYRLYGTPEAVYRYVSSYFDDIILEENWEYDGEPYHFRVTVDGDWTPENEAWARRAIETAKNVRSVLDALQIGSKCSIGMTAEGEVLARFHYPMTGTENWTGRWPDIAHEVVIDKSGGAAAISAEAVAHKMPYQMAGTIPQENTIGVLDQSGAAGIEGVAEAHSFEYAMTGNVETGTVPQESLLAEIEKVQIAISGETDGKKYDYPMSGTGNEETEAHGKDEIQTADAEDIQNVAGRGEDEI